MSNKQSTHFNLNVSGIGYLSRIREVTSRKGTTFLTCTIGALRGDSNDVEYTYFDCCVFDVNAQKLVRRCMPAVAADKKVLIGFSLGDVRAEAFTYERGEKQGQTGASLKAKLLQISYVKVDGQVVHQAPARTPGEATVEVETAANASDVAIAA